MTLLRLAVSRKNWILADNILSLYKGLSVNSRPSSKEINEFKPKTVLGSTLKKQQWGLAEKMLKYDLKANLDAIKINDAPDSIMSYLTILGFDGSDIEQNETFKPITKSIFNTLNRIVTFFYDSWHNPSKEPFQNYYNTDLINQMALEVLYEEQPALKTFSPSVMLKKILAHSILTHEANHIKALTHIATLAFNEFRWQNGLSEQNYTKAQIDDLRRLILDCLEEFEKTNNGVQYTKEKWEQIIKEIGKDQHVDSPSLEKAFIQKAIEKAMSVLVMPSIENLNPYENLMTGRKKPSISIPKRQSIRFAVIA